MPSNPVLLTAVHAGERRGAWVLLTLMVPYLFGLAVTYTITGGGREGPCGCQYWSACLITQAHSCLLFLPAVAGGESLGTFVALLRTAGGSSDPALVLPVPAWIALFSAVEVLLAQASAACAWHPSDQPVCLSLCAPWRQFVSARCPQRLCRTCMEGPPPSALSAPVNQQIPLFHRVATCAPRGLCPLLPSHQIFSPPLPLSPLQLPSIDSLKWVSSVGAAMSICYSLGASFLSLRSALPRDQVSEESGQEHALVREQRKKWAKRGMA